MKKSVALFGFAVLTLAVTGCQQTPADTREADGKTLRDLETQWNKEFASKDMDKLTAHYTDDAVLMASGMPASSGKEAIRKALKDMVADPALSLQFQPSKVEVAKAGDLAWTQGSYTLAFTDPRTKRLINDRGSYVTTYRKQTDGSWKVVADIASSEIPPSAPTQTKAKVKANKSPARRRRGR